MYQTFMVAYSCKTAKSFLLHCTCKFFYFMLILIQPTIFVTLVGTVVVFSPPSMMVFFELACQKEKINTGREGAQGTVQGVSTY